MLVILKCQFQVLFKSELKDKDGSEILEVVSENIESAVISEEQAQFHPADNLYVIKPEIVNSGRLLIDMDAYDSFNLT